MTKAPQPRHLAAVQTAMAASGELQSFIESIIREHLRRQPTPPPVLGVSSTHQKYLHAQALSYHQDKGNVVVVTMLDGEILEGRVFDVTYTDSSKSEAVGFAIEDHELGIVYRTFDNYEGVTVLISYE